MKFRCGLPVFIWMLCGAAFAQIPAFPGAEGFGAYATGGRGGDVYVVTSLNNSGSGTLREALDTAPASGRTIVFAVSGYIPVNSDTNFQVPENVTIAGQTAPGDGVGLKGGRMLIKGNNTIMRHFRIRHGKYGTGGDCLNIDYGIDETMIDHVSLMFSTDENFSFFGTAPDNFTMQYSTSTWGMERHNAGGLWDLDHGTCHHSLWAHHRTRNPKARPVMLEWINNVTFHWRNEGFIMGDSESNVDWRANVMGCYYISIEDYDTNLDSTPLSKARIASDGEPNFSIHLANNLIDADGDGTLNGTDQGYGIISGAEYNPLEGAPSGTERYFKSTTPFAGAPAAVTVDDPLTAYKKVISASGPLRLDVDADSLRDELDSLLFDSVTNQYSILVAKDSPVTGDPEEPPSNGEYLLAQEYGISNNGFGTLNNGVARPDSDWDGMPNDWEMALGSNVAGQDHNTVFANNGSIITAATFFPSNTVAGYTYLEEYLHFCAVPHAWVAKNTAQQPSSVTVDLSRYTCGFSNAPVFTISGVVGGSVQQTGSSITFTPTQDAYGRAGFYFNVTDADGSSWTQQFCILVTASAAPRDLTWTGTNGSAWDSTTINWSSDTQPATTFSIGDAALFDNSGSTTSVALSSNVMAQSVTITGSQSYSFAGPGTLSIIGGFTNSSSGSVTLSTSFSASDGSRLSGGETVIDAGGGLSGGAIELAGGATLSDGTGSGQLLLSTDLQVGSGQSGSLDLSTWADINGNLSGSGTLNIDVNSSGCYFAGDWSGFSGQVNVTANAGSDEFKINRGYDSGLQLASGRLHLGSGVVMHQVVNGPSDDTGTPHNIGELSGDAGAEIGAQPIGGRIADWIIGALNTDSTFAGIIRDSDYQDAWGGYGTSKLSKVGTGKLTLSGNCSYSGITAIWDGELNVTGSLGSNTDVYVGSGATLSGSGAMGRLLSLLTGGTIDIGDTPGDVGTLTTGGGVTLKAGTLTFDLSSNPSSGNDQIVNTDGTLTFDGNEGSAHFEFNLIDGSLSEGTYNLIIGGTGTSAPGSPVFTHNLTDTAEQTYSLQRSGGGSSDTYVRLVVTDLAPEPPSAPTGLSAEAGSTTAILTWSPSVGATGYIIKRAAVSGGPYTAVGTTDSTSLTDTGLVNLTTYYYVVSATNAYGASAHSGQASVTPQIGALKINGGGPTVSPFVADSYYTGGGSWSQTESIDLSGVTDPAPEAAYQTEHNGDFSYTFPGLKAGQYCLVRLHFAEIYHTSTGSRVFDVAINGTQVLNDFDIYAEAGARYKALVREFIVPADGSGQIDIQFTSVTDNAKVSAIEIRSMDAPQPAQPLAWYRFEEGTAGTTVPSGNDNGFWNQVVDSAGGDDNMSAWEAGGAPDYSASVPTATLPQTGTANTLSASFDGSDDIWSNLGGPVQSTVYSDVTIEAYVNFSSLTGFQTIVGRDDTFGNADGGVDSDDRSLLYFSKHTAGHFRIEALTTGSDFVAVEGTVSPKLNTWYHVAAVGDSTAGTLTLYVDGQNVGSTTGFDGLYPSTTLAWTIGRGMYNGSVVDNLSGSVDEVRICSSALSPVQFLNYDPDTDDDGLEDAWEYDKLGDLSQTGSDDPDGDGNDNATEETTGTDPTISSIPPHISVAASAGGLSLGWSSNHIGWTLMSRTNLLTGTWQEVPYSDTTNIYENAAPDDSVFYRLEYSE